MKKKSKQRNHQKKKTNANKKRKQERRSSKTAVVTRLTLAGRAPLHLCLVNANWQERLLATLTFTRLRGDGGYLYATLLVDLGCLGVKNCRSDTNFDKQRYDDLRANAPEPLERIPFELGAKIAEAGAAYAASLGFDPHPDFELCRHIYEGVDYASCETEVVCGREGKPLYVAGPFDDVEMILNRLEGMVGQGEFHFVAPMDTF